MGGTPEPSCSQQQQLPISTLSAPSTLPPPACTDHVVAAAAARPHAGFFSQFGRLLRVRVSRSKKTAKAKHYAFLEFAHPDVAAIAAETMDGYFLFKQVGGWVGVQGGGTS